MCHHEVAEREAKQRQTAFRVHFFFGLAIAMIMCPLSLVTTPRKLECALIQLRSIAVVASR